MSQKLVKISIDGVEMSVPEGSKIIEASLKNDKYIPHFCYHEGLSIVAQCRMCFVEIEGAPKLATACSTPVAEGMKILTQSEKVKQGQNGTLEFTLLNHPLDCPICDRGGECKLQDYTYEYGPPLSRMDDQKEFRDKHRPISEQIVLDQERCILCTRCVRFSAEVDGRKELLVENRGHYNTIEVFEERPLQSPFSGNVVDLCPVGALTAKDFRFAARPWELKKHNAICSGCSVGCNIEIHTKHRHPGIPRPEAKVPTPHIERLVPRENSKVNTWWMCDAGRWGYHFNNEDSKRLREPQAKHSVESPFRTVHIKEIQEAIAQFSLEGEWSFYITDSVPHEEIVWVKELASSWAKRNRKVGGINQSALTDAFMKAWNDKKSSPWVQGECDLNSVDTIVSDFDSYRDLEKIVPILSVKIGTRVRAGSLKWEKREASELYSKKDDAAKTAYLLRAPKSETDIKTLIGLPVDTKFLILWTGANARGLLNEGVAPMELVAASINKSVPSGPVFLVHQNTQNPLDKNLVSSLSKCSKLVMATSFISELSEKASVLLPLTPLYESTCTLTSLENFKQTSAGIRLDHPNHNVVPRGGPTVNPSLRLI